MKPRTARERLIRALTDDDLCFCGGDACPTPEQYVDAHAREVAEQQAPAAEETERARLAAELEDAETRATGFLTERDQAQAALVRVRRLVTATAATTAPGISDYDIGRHDLATKVAAELDGTEQPATED